MACRPHSCVWGQLLTRRAGRTQGQPAPAGLGRHERRLSRCVKQIGQQLTPPDHGVPAVRRGGDRQPLPAGPEPDRQQRTAAIAHGAPGPSPVRGGEERPLRIVRDGLPGHPAPAGARESEQPAASGPSTRRPTGADLDAGAAGGGRHRRSAADPARRRDRTPAPASAHRPGRHPGTALRTAPAGRSSGPRRPAIRRGQQFGRAGRRGEAPAGPGVEEQQLLGPGGPRGRSGATLRPRRGSTP